MSSLYTSIVRVRGWVTRLIRDCETELKKADDELTVTHIEALDKRLETQFCNYEEKFMEFINSDPDDEDYKREESEFERLAKSVSAFHLELQKKIQTLRIIASTLIPTGASNPNPSTPMQPRTKFPTLEIPKFSGKHEEWAEFWDIFNSLVHSNNNVDHVIKFTHLRNALTGRAKESIRGFKTTAADYLEAVDFLQREYANKLKIQRVLIRKLLDMKKPSMNADALTKFKQEVETSLRSLKVYKNVEDCYWIFSELILRLLPSEAEDWIVIKYKTEYPEYDDILKGLSEFIRRMENTGDYKQKENKQINVVENKVKSSSVTPSLKQSVGSYTTTAKNSDNIECVFCGLKNHTFEQCFRVKDVNMRVEKLKENRRCVKCTKKGHLANKCYTSMFCELCDKKGHLSALCYYRDSSSSINLAASGDSGVTQTNEVSQNKPNSHKTSENAVKPKVKQKIEKSVNVTTVGVITMNAVQKKIVKPSLPSCALATATGKVSNPRGTHWIETRLFCDQGSQCSFITKDLADKLNLKSRETIRLGIDAFRSETREGNFPVTSVVLKMGPRRVRIKLLIVEDLPISIHSPGIAKAAAELKSAGFTLADKHLDSDIVEDIGIVLGALHYGTFVKGFDKWESYDLMITTAGVILYGQIPNAPPVTGNHETTLAMSVGVKILPTEISQLVDDHVEPVHKLWELESIGINPQEESYEDTAAVQTFQDTIKYEDGQYWVRLPWKSIHPPLPHNFSRAMGQLTTLMDQMRRDPLKFSHYDKVIKEQLSMGFIEKVKEEKMKLTNCHYLPHHGVSKDSATTPLRVVFNCSSQSGPHKVSLNDCLITGPSLTQKLLDVLVKFRSGIYAFTADISKAFLRVGLQEEDRDYTRFLWVKDMENEPTMIDVYRFKAVMFGSTSSPFLLQATLAKHLTESRNPLGDKILQGFYVDNYIGTCEREEELFELFHAANVELSKAKMPLRMWNSNNVELQAVLDTCYTEESRASEVSILGTQWNVETDELNIKHVQFKEVELTKRSLLSLVSSVFDPLGLISPLLIKGKLLIQKAWKEKIAWDSPLSVEIVDEWEILKGELQNVEELKFPRNVCPSPSYKLHVFCDASTKAYGAVAYIVGDGQSRLLMSKAKVAPLSTRSLPQLELTALYVGIHLISYIVSTLSLEFEVISLWSDSSIAIQWIATGNSDKVYVANRTADIRRLCERYKVQVNHVSTKENPADLLTRGCSFKVFKEENMWKHGPRWLADWSPCEVEHDIAHVTVNEIVSEFPCFEVPEPLFDYTRMSSLKKILNVTEKVFEFIRKLKPNSSLPKGAMSYWLQHLQSCHYGKIKLCLNQGRLEGSQDSKNMIRQLGLYMDSDKIIHCHGRVENSDLQESACHPVLLSPKDHLTELIVLKCHQDCSHGGVNASLNQVRQEFWIPKGRQCVKKVLSKCVHCKKVGGRPYIYPGPPPLPKERVSFTVPFETVGVDYTGMIKVSKNREESSNKYYICLFTCAATRAVHLELAKDLSAETFLLLFRKFVARRSLPQLLISDNATNLTATSNFLKELAREPSIQDFMENHKIRWEFIAPRAPWQGGFYERLIGIVKSVLHKVLFKCKVSSLELETVITEIEAVVNNRPLTYINSEFSNECALTPSLLIQGRNIQIAPTLLDYDPQDVPYRDAEELRESYVTLSKVLDKFKKVFTQEYISALREKHYGAQKAVNVQNIKKGDVILVQSDNFRDYWPLGRVMKLKPGDDGVVRSVEVLVNGKIITRTIEKLIPLETDVSVSESVPEERLVRNDEPEVAVRPKRQAAQRADDLRAHLIHEEML